MQEKTLESPLDSTEIQPVHPKGDQSWVFVRRTDAEAEALILCPPDVKSQLIGKDPDTRKDWGQEEKGAAEDEMVGWHHWLNGHKFEQTPGNSKGQGSLASCSPWGREELDMTEQLATTTGWWFWNLSHQLSGSNQSGVYMLLVRTQSPSSTRIFLFISLQEEPEVLWLSWSNH